MPTIFIFIFIFLIFFQFSGSFSKINRPYEPLGSMKSLLSLKLNKVSKNKSEKKGKVFGSSVDDKKMSLDVSRSQSEKESNGILTTKYFDSSRRNEFDREVREIRQGESKSLTNKKKNWQRRRRLIRNIKYKQNHHNVGYKALMLELNQARTRVHGTKAGQNFINFAPPPTALESAMWAVTREVGTKNEELMTDTNIELESEDVSIITLFSV